MAQGFEKLPYEVIALIISYVPMWDYYWVKQAGSHVLANVIRDILARTPRGQYLQTIQADYAHQHGLQSKKRRPAMQIMIERGQAALVRHYQDKYAAHRKGHTPHEYDVRLSEAATSREKNCFIPALHWAAFYGEEEIVRLLLDRVHIRAGRLGRTALHYAAEKNQVRIAELLLQNGAYINALDNRGKTPLAVALKNRADEVAKLLKSKGALIDFGTIIDEGDEEWANVLRTKTEARLTLSQTVQQYFSPQLIKRAKALRLYADYLRSWALFDTSILAWDRKRLFSAALYENIRFMVAFVLDQGHDVNAALDSKGTTALHVAADQENIPLTMLLLERGANPLISSYHGRRRETPMQYALFLGRMRIFQFYRDRGYSVDTKNCLGQTALYLAAGNGRVDLVEELLSKGAEVDATDPRSHNTPLHVAIQESGPKQRLVELLVGAGASVEARNRDGHTPLMLAVAFAKGESFKELFLYLLEHGASINTRDTKGRGVLHQVAGRQDCHGEIAKVLLESGADLHTKDETLRSALHESLTRGHMSQPGFQLLLVERGIGIKSKDKDGLTPLHLAVGNEYDAAATTYGWSPIVAVLLERAAGVNSKDNQGRTPLHFACAQTLADRTLCDALLARGANVNAQDSLGHTPLHTVLSHEGMDLDFKLEICGVLLEYRANVNIRDATGSTAFHCALRCCPTKSWSNASLSDIIELLLSHGADVHARDSSDCSVLDLCGAVGEEVEVLVKKAVQSAKPEAPEAPQATGILSRLISTFKFGSKVD